MDTLVRCKTCGYVMEAGKVGEKCPACGVSAKQFEPYDDKLSDRRRLLMSLDIHPVVVHLPQAFAASLVVLAALLSVLADGPFRLELLDAARVLGAVLPFSVAAAFAAGLFDGKLRFRRVITPVLIRKMIVGGFFFLASLAGGGLAVFEGLTTRSALAGFGVAEILSLIAGSTLGIWGSRLVGARLPGK
jgi:hypothetical protein